ncbi:phosphopantetheine-binding protein, partial [Streptomyces rhizosphaericus]
MSEFQDYSDDFTPGNSSAPAGSVSSAEQNLIRIWSGVLGHARIGTESIFFELSGGDNDARELCKQVEEEFGVPVTVDTLRENPTVAGLARYLGQAVFEQAVALFGRVPVAEGSSAEMWGSGAASGSPASDVNSSRTIMARADRADLLPLSFAQQRLWFLDRLTPGSVEYSLPLSFRVRGLLDVPALEG